MSRKPKADKPIRIKAEKVPVPKDYRRQRVWSAGLITTVEVLERVKVSRPTLAKMISEGRFPAPNQFHKKLHGFDLKSVEAWQQRNA
jgi:predicted DNA-binding transcriptional regulator AlpA